MASELARRYARQYGPGFALDEVIQAAIDTATAPLIDLIEDAFCQAADVVDYDQNADPAKNKNGWYDSMSISTTCDLGDALVEAGRWERHPDGCGRRQFYRPKKEAGEDE